MLHLSFRAGVSGIAVASFLLACRASGAHSAENGNHDVAAPTVTAVLALGETGPKMDLLASRALWHLYQEGLVIPFAGEGFRKYSQEYNNPWRGTAKLDEHVGRSLGSTAATLHFPWNEAVDEATMVVRVQGSSAGKKLSLRLNGRPLKNTGLDNGWQQVVIAVPAHVLVKGENTLLLAAGKKGAIFHSIDIIPGKPPAASPSWPATSPGGRLTIAGKELQGLTAFARLVMPVEVPPGGWLVVGTGTATAPSHFRVSVAREGQSAKVLLDDKQPAATVRERRVDLGEFSGKLVTLELAVLDGQPSDAIWIAPRLLLPAAPSLPRPEPVRNTIMLVADALRADKLPMYATTRVRTPNIAKAAQTSGVTFTATQAASPSSPPSHASIQSGCLPRSHGILGDTSKVNAGTPMVSAILAKAGIATDFVGDASFAMRRLNPVSTWNEFHQPNGEGKGGDCQAVIKQILAFADKQAGKRFFISAVAFEAHTPYIYHEDTIKHYYEGPMDPAIGKSPDGTILSAIVGGKLKMTQERWGQLKGLYDGEVEHLDTCFGALTDGLKSRGLADNTAVILLADHGEGFLEHGSMGHAYGHYAELTNVPLVLFRSGLGHGQKISTVVGHADVVPTIVDLMGVPADARVQGQSLLPMILRQGPWVPRVMPSEYGRSFSLRSASLHYIVDYAGNESLYDIAIDPAEKTELKDKRPVALRYFRDLTGLYLAHRAQWHATQWGTLNNQSPSFPAD